MKRKVQQMLIRMIEAEFPHYSLPDQAAIDYQDKGRRAQTHYRKMSELRKLFRLRELITTKFDFEEERRLFRQKHGIPAENLVRKVSPFNLFHAPVWGSLERSNLWKEVSQDERKVLFLRADSINEQTELFKVNELHKLLADPEFKNSCWVLTVISSLSIINTF